MEVKKLPVVCRGNSGSIISALDFQTFRLVFWLMRRNASIPSS
jgi:hypothetical protein